MEDEFDPYSLPPEVTTPPYALIGMMGLDVAEKATHKSVWEAFALNRRTDRTPLHFRLLSPDFQMPPMKQKRQSYEWYIPKGILKSNWISKYLYHVPALVVLFYDLDWNDNSWTEKKNDLASKVQSLKTVLGSRNSRVALVLIQSGISVPGEDTGAAEKAATLCTACDLPAKHLFVLPHSDAHLLGYTVRLENALSEIAWTFYLGEAKGVRAHRDFLNKTNHTLLFVRHQFKLGFLNELRNDSQTAIKHYAQCYHHLLDLRSTDTNLHEIRIVAAVINYKICRLDFALNLPRDAIAQFRRHIDQFRQRTGPKELIFEHYAWLSKQYQIFGDVFEEAVRIGLPAVQTQHPGFYYQQAAQYAVLRRKTALQVCKEVSAPVSDLLEGWSKLEFYGQRPWRPGKHSLEPPEQQREAEGIKEIQYHEVKEVNHSNTIIPLFSSAISQFKKYRCPRIKRHLMVQMAEEYHQANDSSKALTLLNHVMWDYRSEKWWSLLSSACTLALQCAYNTAALTEYFGIALEFMGTKLLTSLEEKKRVHDNLMKLFSGQSPDPEPGTPAEVVTVATEAWSALLGSQVSPVTVDMTTLVPCLEVRASFTRSQFHVDQEVGVTVKIRNSYLTSISLSSVSVGTNSPSYNDRLLETQPEKLVLLPGQVTEIHLSFVPLVEDVGKKVKVTGVRAQMGVPGSSVVVGLQWTGPGNEGVTMHAANTPAFPEFSLLYKDNFDISVPIAEMEVLPRQPRLEFKVDHDTTALVWEWLPVKVHFTNNEESIASDISLSFGLDPSSPVNLEHATQVCTSSGLLSDKLGSQVNSFSYGEMGVGEQSSVTFYVKSLTASDRILTLKLEYTVSLSSGGSVVHCPCVSEKNIHLQARIPFQVTVETQSLKFEKVGRVAGGENFLVVPKIKCTSHVPITFTDSSLALANEVSQVGTESKSQVMNTELSEGEMGVDCFCISLSKKSLPNSALTLGQYVLYWKRSNSDSPAVSVSVGLPSVMVEHWGVWVECEVAPQGTVRTPLPLAYTISNHGAHTAELALNMQVSDAFMYAGHKEVRLRVLPSCSERVTYTLYPLLAGNVHLPKLTLSVESHSPGQPTSLDALLARTLPTHVYIMPQAKDNDPGIISVTGRISTMVVS
ncbi:trafficking protein particle complex subunit 11-like [Homarus americanus]|uniref:trafficking protein particle complex subunit 11-like n=1 Tax=Homarus americanus TaxID=6706 RepID=UPI001C48D761|nr:trafficking protein particle complex subunit 11-like [Homarus americanus]XP_042226163.1 trafficking protein particle complex subunit 11-like [Homarus americanus]XP_042226171.1 trafficking protein particle complex subunit 11-like [Homarus americanus]